MAKISVGGINPFRTYSKNVGDVVEGEVVNDKSSGEQQLRVALSESPLLLQGADMFVYIPLSYLKPFDSSPNNSDSKETFPPSSNDSGSKETFFTPKRIIVGAVAAVFVFGLLKISKVI